MKEKIDIIKNTIEDLKGEEIVTLNVTNKTSEANYIVIATGNSKRHISSMAENVRQEIKLKGFFVRTIEGENTDWLLIDCGEIIVHIMTKDSREFYNLEKLWGSFSEN